MGSFSTKEKDSVKEKEIIYEKIQLADLLDQKNNSHQKFCESLRDRGFAVITLNETTQKSVKDLLDAAHVFFGQPLEAKQKIAREKDDPILKGIGIKPNAGYLYNKKVKEYLKLKPTDADVYFPSFPLDFKEKFTALFDNFRTIARTAFKAAATFQAKSIAKEIKEYPEDKPQVPNELFKSGSDTHSYMKQRLWEDVDKLAFDRSSVSIINYFRNTDVIAEDTKNGENTSTTSVSSSSMSSGSENTSSDSSSSSMSSDTSDGSSGSSHTSSSSSSNDTTEKEKTDERKKNTKKQWVKRVKYIRIRVS